jgi:hypothetical protein
VHGPDRQQDGATSSAGVWAAGRILAGLMLENRTQSSVSTGAAARFSFASSEWGAALAQRRDLGRAQD